MYVSAATKEINMEIPQTLKTEVLYVPDVPVLLINLS